MDWLKTGKSGGEFWKKYRFAMMIIALGAVLMLAPGKEQPVQNITAEEHKQMDTQESLQEILSKIQGAGKVSVLLTQKKGEEIVYQTDEELYSGDSTDSRKSKTILTMDTERKETGLIRVVYPPVLQGAVIVCQGGNDPKVKLAIVEAVSRATGLPSSSICVLKMK